MKIKSLVDGLKGLGFPINIYVEKNRIYVNGNKEFNEYLTIDDDGHISLKVFLKTMKPGVKLSPEEYQKLKVRKDYLIDAINGLELGFTLNKNGEKA